MTLGRMLVAGSAAAGLVAGTMLAGTALAGTRPAVAASVRGYLAAGQTGTAATVPWQKVGPGWALARYSATSDKGGHSTPGPVTLYLTDPSGGRYELHRWTASKNGGPVLIDWSADKVQALLAVFGSSTSTIEQLNLRTGKMTTITLRNVRQFASVAYAQLDGSDLLVASASQNQELSEYSMTGTLQRKLPGEPDSVLLSPGGRQLVEGAKAGLTLLSGAGKTIGTLRVPADSCSPVRYWTSSSILAFCSTTRYTEPGRLWIVPTDGRAPRALTSAHLTAPDLGNGDAWQLPGGIYLQASGACGTLYIARQHANGTTSPVNVPGTNGTRNVIVTAHNGRLLVQAGTGCGSGNSLLWFNPANRHEDWLLRNGQYTAGVTAVVPFPSIQNTPLPLY
jgi:hypothetical protein